MASQGSGVLVGLVVGLALGVGCGAEPPATEAKATSTATLAVTAPVVARPSDFGAGGHPGVRFDMRDRIEHVRALQKQPDGTYKSVCIDGAEALRPAVRR